MPRLPLDPAVSVPSPTMIKVVERGDPVPPRKTMRGSADITRRPAVTSNSSAPVVGRVLQLTVDHLLFYRNESET
jgi:hypothetical protein